MRLPAFAALLAFLALATPLAAQAPVPAAPAQPPAAAPDLQAGEAARILREARRGLAEGFNIDHVTIQLEDQALRAEEKTLHV